MAHKLFSSIGKIAAGAAVVSLVVATSASADPRHYRRHHDRGGDTAAVAIAAGIVGLAVGAAISDGNRNDRYDDRYYGRRAYAPPPPPRYGYGYGYAPRPYYGDRECWTTRDYDRYEGVYRERTVCR